MKIGLVTVTFNSEEVLPDFLDSVSAQTHDNYTLYVVDNASVDKTLEGLRYFPKEKIHITPNKDNLGVAAGNNQGIEQALADGCDYVLLINNDTLFEDQLLEKSLSVSLTQKNSMVVPKMMYHDQPNMIWYAGGFFDKKKAYLNFHRGQHELDKGQYLESLDVDYAPTCCVLIHKKVFHDIGMMDERYFVYFDDADFFFRVMKDGRHKLRYFHDIEFYHKIGSLTKSRLEDRPVKYGDFFLQQMTKNHVVFLKKQKNIEAYFFVVFLWFYFTLRFFFNKRIVRNFKTFKLIQKSYFKGLLLKV